ncbi:hypothetical protein HII31_05088 [Pseudocercospora fuligena]|uniref:Uncharacterized protein n=1 Tax=Pseudocercospora fuligena TaxID=685502 RepID=A0A8H6RM92_9PEZI|nr:hypothetical protein HII31_05088 [Pseudocercospora fuligena]
MASVLERFTSQLAAFNSCELEWIKACCDSKLKEREAAMLPPPCRLLDLAAELRNRIYHFVILDHISGKDFDNFRLPDLASCNKQLRSELLHYGKRTHSFKLLKPADDEDTPPGWEDYSNAQLARAILKAGYARDDFFDEWYETRDSAESRAHRMMGYRLAEEDEENLADYSFGFMEELWGGVGASRCTGISWLRNKDLEDIKQEVLGSDTT